MDISLENLYVELWILGLKGLNIACNYFSDLGTEQGHQLMKE